MTAETLASPSQNFPYFVIMQSASDAHGPALSIVLALRAPPRRVPVLVRLYRRQAITADALVAGWRVGAGLDAQALDLDRLPADVAVDARTWGRARVAELISLAADLGPGPAWAVLVGVAGLDLAPAQLDRSLSLAHGRALDELHRGLGAAVQAAASTGPARAGDGTIHRGGKI